MLIIRQEQIDEFIRASAKSFEDCMVIHLKEFFPEECQGIGDPGVRETTRYGIGRAQSHGITAERDVCKYIDLMLALGHDFDTDPDLPWAHEILYDETLTDPTERIDRLCHMAIQKQGKGITGNDGR